MPLQTAALTAAQIDHFQTQGYLVLPHLFAPADLIPIREEIAQVIDRVACGLRSDGTIADAHKSAPFERRLSLLFGNHPDTWETFRRAIEGRAGGGHAGRAMFDLITHPRLLDAMESLVGAEIVGSSVYRIRPKLPGLVRGEVPWHQDSGYFAAHCDTDLIVTVWIPLIDATVENGCLYVLPRAHRQGVVTHHTGGPAGYLVVEPQDLPAHESQAIPVPIPLGGALLLTNLTPHCSRTNFTEDIRWSVDLRYQARSLPNNLELLPAGADEGGPEYAVACYPPEADFIVRSRRDPATVHTYEQFVQRRAAYEFARIPGPKRGWTPINA